MDDDKDKRPQPDKEETDNRPVTRSPLTEMRDRSVRDNRYSPKREERKPRKDSEDE